MNSITWIKENNVTMVEGIDRIDPVNTIEAVKTDRMILSDDVKVICISKKAVERLPDPPETARHPPKTALLVDKNSDNGSENGLKMCLKMNVVLVKIVIIVKLTLRIT